MNKNVLHVDSKSFFSDFRDNVSMDFRIHLSHWTIKKLSIILEKNQEQENFCRNHSFFHLMLQKQI